MAPSPQRPLSEGIPHRDDAMSEDVGLDRIIHESLRDFAGEMLVSQWHGKEHG
jgi:hypothetical protein